MSIFRVCDVLRLQTEKQTITYFKNELSSLKTREIGWSPQDTSHIVRSPFWGIAPAVALSTASLSCSGWDTVRQHTESTVLHSLLLQSSTDRCDDRNELSSTRRCRLRLGFSPRFALRFNVDEMKHVTPVRHLTGTYEHQSWEGQFSSCKKCIHDACPGTRVTRSPRVKTPQRQVQRNEHSLAVWTRGERPTRPSWSFTATLPLGIQAANDSKRCSWEDDS